MFELNIWLDLSREAVTKMFGSLVTKLLLQVLGKSTGTMTIWVIRGDEVWEISQAYEVFRGASAGSVQLKLD